MPLSRIFNDLHTYYKQYSLVSYVKQNNIEGVKYYISRGVNPNFKIEDGSILNIACKLGYTEIAKALILAGANPNICNKSGNTPLHYAAWYGHEDVVKALIDVKVDVNAINEDGCLPLHWAAFKGNLGAANLLLVSGAQYDIKDSNGLTPLEVADQYLNKDTYDLMLAYSLESTLSTEQDQIVPDLQQETLPAISEDNFILHTQLGPLNDAF